MRVPRWLGLHGASAATHSINCIVNSILFSLSFWKTLVEVRSALQSHLRPSSEKAVSRWKAIQSWQSLIGSYIAIQQVMDKNKWLYTNSIRRLLTGSHWLACRGVETRPNITRLGAVFGKYFAARQCRLDVQHGFCHLLQNQNPRPTFRCGPLSAWHIRARMALLPSRLAHWRALTRILWMIGWRAPTRAVKRRQIVKKIFELWHIFQGYFSIVWLKEAFLQI